MDYFIKSEDLWEDFYNSEAIATSYMGDWAEYEDIAKNRPVPIDKSLSGELAAIANIGDSTTFGLLDKRPSRIVQRLMTGHPRTKNKSLNIAGEFLLNKVLMPNANYGYDAFMKTRWAVWNAGVYGSAFIIPFMRADDKLGGSAQADFRLVKNRNIILGRGGLSAEDHKVVYEVCFRTIDDLKAMVEAAEEHPEIDTGVKVGNVKNLIRNFERNSYDYGHSGERSRYQNPSIIRTIKAYQAGVKAWWYEFYPEANKSAVIIKQRKNPYASGDHGVVQILEELDEDNPYGRSRIAGGLLSQRILNHTTTGQHIANMTRLNPPVIHYGQPIIGGLDLSMGAQNEAPEADSRTEPIDHRAIGIDAYNSSYDRSRQQIVGFMGGSALDISGSNNQISKTDTSIKAQLQNQNVEDLVIVKNLEDGMGKVMSKMLELHFTLSRGDKEYVVDEITKKQLMTDVELTDSQRQSLETKSTMIVHYSKIKEFLPNLEVDAKSSSRASDLEEAEAINEMLNSQNPEVPAQFDTRALTYRRFELIGPPNLRNYLRPEDEADIPPQEVIQQQVAEQVETILSEAGVGHPIARLIKEANIPFKDYSEQTKRFIETELGFPGGTPPSVLDRHLDRAKIVAGLQGATTADVVTEMDPPTPQEQNPVAVGVEALAASRQQGLSPAEALDNLLPVGG